MKKLLLIIIFILICIPLFGQTKRTTTQPLNLLDESWTPSGSLADGDTLIVDHPITISGNINMSTIDLVVYFNEEITFGNPSFWRLGKNSMLYFNNNVIVDNGNNNDRIEIGGYRYNEGDVAIIKEGDVLTETGTLPVELLCFDIIITNENLVKLVWQTASETNNDYFLIEKSTNLEYFEYVDIVNGSLNSNSVKEYSISVDPKEKTYYKLTQFDIDGKFEELGIVVFDELNIDVYGLNLNHDEHIINVQYYDVDGKEVDNTTDGFYMIKITTNKRIYMKKYFKY